MFIATGTEGTDGYISGTITWSYKSKTVSTTIGRFAMAWKFGQIPQGYVIDHINNNSLLDDYDN